MLSGDVGEQRTFPTLWLLTIFVRRECLRQGKDAHFLPSFGYGVSVLFTFARDTQISPEDLISIYFSLRCSRVRPF